MLTCRKDYVTFKEGKKAHLHVCCLQDTSSRAPTGSPRTSNRSAAANVANAMPQSGNAPLPSPCTVTTMTLHFCLKPASRYSAGQTNEGVLANFFNSLLTKKSGTGATGTPGGGNNTPGTVRKSGEKSRPGPGTRGKRRASLFQLRPHLSLSRLIVSSHPPPLSCFTVALLTFTTRTSQRMLATLRCVGDGHFCLRMSLPRLFLCPWRSKDMKRCLSPCSFCLVFFTPGLRQLSSSQTNTSAAVLLRTPGKCSLISRTVSRFFPIYSCFYGMLHCIFSFFKLRPPQSCT